MMLILLVSSLALLLFVAVHYASAFMDLQLLQTFNEQSNATQQVCVYDGSQCELDSAYCDRSHSTCRDAFPRGFTMKEKYEECDKVFHDKSAEKGKLKVCVFFMGRQTVAKVLDKGYNIENFIDGFDKGGPRDEFCPFAVTSCKLGEEFCSSATKKCEPLFPENFPEQKYGKCLEIINNSRSTEPGLYKSCAHFLVAVMRDRVREQSGASSDEEFCPLSGSNCKLGEEFCSQATGRCEPLFSGMTSEKEKFEKCQKISKEDGSQYKSCLYFLGADVHEKADAKKPHPHSDAHGPASEASDGIEITTLTFTIFACALLIALMFQKLWWEPVKGWVRNKMSQYTVPPNTDPDVLSAASNREMNSATQSQHNQGE